MTDVRDETDEMADQISPPDHKRTTFGTGLLKGLSITMRHLLSRSVTVQYPDEKPDLPARTRGVIALKEETCTVCMLCARECPDWCIYIEGHKEERAPAQEGKRAKKVNVLDRFAIDYALCMYCGICVEVCPYDALFWSPEFEYAEHDITGLTHEMEKLTEWMYTVPPPDPLEEGAQGPEFKSLAQKVAAKAPAEEETKAPAKEETKAPAKETKAPDQQTDGSAPQPPSAEGSKEDPPKSPDDSVEAASEAEDAQPTDQDGEPPDPPTADDASEADEEKDRSDGDPPKGMTDEEAEAFGQKVYEEEIGKGVDPRVAEGRRKAAVIRAKKGTAGPGSSES